MTHPPFFTTVHDVLDPLTGERTSLRGATRAPAAAAARGPRGGGRDVDGSAWWVLPALYDADAHMPHVHFGVRDGDVLRAFSGGVAQANVAVPWQLVAGLDLAGLVADVTATRGLRVVPLLSVWPHADSADFPAWLARQAGGLPAPMPAVCKLYSADPNLARNLDALWAAGIKPMVWCAEPAHLERVVAHAGGRPLHLRHATSAAMLDVMARAGRASVQTSPHFLLPLAQGKATSLEVLPAPPDDASRASLAAAFLARVDVVASDHVAPHYAGPPISPGLQTQQHFLPAMLTLCERFGWPLAEVLAKATTAPAQVFGTPMPAARLLVDPTHVETVHPWPTQAPQRAPFEGLALKGRVLAVAGADDVALV